MQIRHVVREMEYTPAFVIEIFGWSIPRRPPLGTLTTRTTSSTTRAPRWAPWLLVPLHRARTFSQLTIANSRVPWEPPLFFIVKSTI